MKRRVLFLAAAIVAIGFHVVAAEPAAVCFIANEPIEGQTVPLLQREILRQAVATVCREEMGLVVRDELLGDQAPDDTALHLITQILPKPANSYTLSLFVSGNQQAIWQGSFPKSYIIKLLEDAEVAAELKEALASVQPARLIKSGMLKLPDSLSVDSPRVADLVHVLRIAHDSCISGKISRKKYEVLVRGYANLGQLTSHSWATSYKAYQARSLVYAQRFVREQPDSAQAYYLRAYAFGMCGLHNRALKDLAMARTLSSRSEPKWVALLDDLLHFRTDALLIASGEESPLAFTASIMALITLDTTPFENRIFDNYESRLNDPNTELRTLFQLNESGGVSSLHQTTITGYKKLIYLVQNELPYHPLFSESLQQKQREILHTCRPTMRQIVEFNANVCTENRSLESIPPFTTALQDETVSGKDRNEPSLAAFGNILQENMFMVVYWRQHFLDKLLSTDIDSFTEKSLPYVSNHPRKDLLMARSIKKHKSEKEYLAYTQTIEVTELPPSAYWFFEGMYLGKAQYGSLKGTALRQRYMKAMDPCFTDLMRRLKLTTDKSKKAGLGKQLQAASPYAPFGQSMLVAHSEDWEPLLEKFEAKGPIAPAVAQAVAYRYWYYGDYEKAIPYYERVLNQFEDIREYEKMAFCYLKTGDEKMWIKIVEHALTLPDHGLNRAQVCMKVAKQYMLMGEAEKAFPYAEAGAKSYSYWSLSMYARVAMALGKKEIAQKTIQAIYERYGARWPVQAYHKALIYQFESPDPWFEDIEILAMPIHNNPGTIPLNRFMAGFHWWRQKDYARANEHLGKLAQEKDDVWYLILDALLQLEQGEEARFSAILDHMIDDFEKTRKHTGREEIRDIASVMRKNINRTMSGAELHHELLSIRKDRGTKKVRDSDYYFYTGKYLALIGHEQEAIQHFYLGIDAEETQTWTGGICYFELMERGLDPFARYRGEIPAYPAE